MAYPDIWFLLFSLVYMEIEMQSGFLSEFSLTFKPHLLIYQCALECFSSCSPMVILPEHSVIHLHLMAPLSSVSKINTDGSRTNSSGLIRVAGLLRDSCWSWIKGLSVNLGYGSFIEAELWGLFWRLNIAWDAGFRMVEIECDAYSTVALLKVLLCQHTLSFVFAK